MLVFVEGGKPQNPENKKHLKQGKNQQMNVYDTGPELNVGHIDGR